MAEFRRQIAAPGRRVMHLRHLLPKWLVCHVLAALLAGCGLISYEPGAASANTAADDPLAQEARRLLDTDRAFAAKSTETDVLNAFKLFLDEQGMQLSAAGAPVVGRGAILQRMAEGPPMLLSWEPVFAEVFAPGDWGWTWGEWQAHEPGAGGRRLAQGKYVNLWKKQADGTWKVRMDMGSARREP